MQQLTLDLPAAPGCQYGSGPGRPRVCPLPATHAAVSILEPADCDPSCGLAHDHHRDGHTARMECCRAHADYYASAWAWPRVGLYPGAWRVQRSATWIETLPT